MHGTAGWIPAHDVEHWKLEGNIFGPISQHPFNALRLVATEKKEASRDCLSLIVRTVRGLGPTDPSPYTKLSEWMRLARDQITTSGKDTCS